MSVLALKLYSCYNTCTVDSHQLRNFVNGRCLPRAYDSLGDSSSLRSRKNGDFCCPDLHFGPFTLALLGRAENLHQPLLAEPPHALRSFLAAGRERIKDELKEGSLELDFMWQHMWPPCLHISACFVSLGVEVLPATCEPPASLGRTSSSCHTKEMLKLPLQLTQGGRRFLGGAKM